ncbi:MAG: two-component system cell cycle sensor histidine kinase/response regulator CckA [Yoonia sp.]
MHNAEDRGDLARENMWPWLMIVIILAAVAISVAGFFLSPLASLQALFVAVGVAIVCFSVGRFGIENAALRRRTIGRAALLQVLEHDPDHAFLTDAEGNIVSWNKLASDKFGDVEGKSIGAVFTTILANPDAVLFRLLERADISGYGKEDVVTRGGHYRLVLTKIDGDTYLWRLEETGKITKPGLRDSDSLSIPLLTIGSRGAVLFVNEACRAFLGYRPKSIDDVFGEAIVRSGQVRAVTASSGDVHVTAAVVEGVAGRKEVYLIPSEADFGPRELSAEWDAIEDLPVPLLKISSDGAVLASNREARNLLGIATTDGKRVGDMLDGLGRPIADWLREAIDGRGGYVSQFLRGRGDHHDTFVQVTLNTAGGTRDPHLIAVLNDVTELKTLEAQFVQSQKMQAIGQLAGGVAHDFNNLLTAISGHCDLLLLRHDQGDQNYGDLIQIHENANRAASLVGQLLAFSRKQNLQPEVIDLRDTLSDLTHLLNRLVGEKVILTLLHAQDLEQIKADKRQLEQVLMNLVVNARDAMPAGGEIRVVTQNVTYAEQIERDRAVVPPGDYVLVKVIDVGHGIPPERLPKIFEPFYTTKRTGEGTGLGLSTAYGIVKQTGGFIFAESEVDHGTEFSLLFPVHEVTVAPAATPAPILPKPLTGSDEGVVLLVEDEAPVRAFASRALRLRGYTVLEADCAETALSMLADPDLSVDIFVTDVIMPGMDGPTWVREALAERPNTKVVFVSGYAEDAFGDEGNQIPNSIFLPKPFSLNDLTVTVRGQLQGA